jgi:hypothetical protein
MPGQQLPNPNPYSFIGLLDNDADDSQCTATLIRADLALTATHCLAGARYGDIRITFGALNRQRDVVNPSPPGVVIRSAIDGFVHKDANLLRGDLHMQVLQLDSPVAGITPVRLASKADRALWTEGRPVTAIGWGVIDNHKTFTSELRSARMRIGDHATVGPSRRGMLSTDAVAGHPAGGDSGGPLLAGSPESGFVQVGVYQIADAYNRVGLADDLLSLPVLNAPAPGSAVTARPGGRFGGEGTVGIVSSSWQENQLLRPDPAIPPNPPRVSADIYQIVTPATVKPGTQVQIKHTFMRVAPAINYTPAGPECRNSFDEPFDGIPFRWVGIFEQPPRVHIYKFGSAGTKPPFTDSRNAVKSRKIAETVYPPRFEPCKSFLSGTETRRFTAPRKPGRYAISWGFAGVSRMLSGGTEVPLDRVDYRIAGKLPTLTVQP